MSVTRARGTSIGTTKKIILNTQPPVENLLGSPITLPTSEPSTGQWTYTIQQTDFPTLPQGASFNRYAPILYFSGKTVTANTISYRVLYNGSSVVTGTTSSITANYYWTISIVNSAMAAVGGGKPAVGDTIEVRLWSSQSDTQYLYNAFQIIPSRPIVTKTLVLKDLWFSGDCSQLLTLGNPVAASVSSWSVAIPYFTGTMNSPTPPSSVNSGNSISSLGSSNDLRISYFPMDNPTNGLGGAYFGDYGLATSVTLNTHTSYYPYYQRNRVPASISFREVWLTK